jgi:hypothetical protein
MQKKQVIQALRTTEEQAVFWAWADQWGCDSWKCFVGASLSGVMELKMSPKELNAVLQGFANDDSASWAEFKSIEGQRFMVHLEEVLNFCHRETSETESNADNNVCIICMAAPISVSLVHSNETSHLCVCVECSDRLKAQVPPGPCPVCRAPIVVHLKNVFTPQQKHYEQR